MKYILTAMVIFATLSIAQAQEITPYDVIDDTKTDFVDGQIVWFFVSETNCVKTEDGKKIIDIDCVDKVNKEEGSLIKGVIVIGDKTCPPNNFSVRVMVSVINKLVRHFAQPTIGVTRDDQYVAIGAYWERTVPLCPDPAAFFPQQNFVVANMRDLKNKTRITQDPTYYIYY